MSTFDAKDIARALAYQLTAHCIPSADPYIGGNLHITGFEERQMIRNSMDFEEFDDREAIEGYVQWCVDFRNAQRSLWDSERAPIEHAIFQQSVILFKRHHHRPVTPEVSVRLQAAAKVRANEKLRRMKQKDIEGWKQKHAESSKKQGLVLKTEEEAQTECSSEDLTIT
ncbi:hypothetical protein BT96DRAFT_1004243 [Gymnopus androsaceus JB14]|uniref:Uncharacterized protein n=1 Tax=Gymnopus androsaceus JB14 TaxID=1447944 RepID=A0A6A4GSG1_9AGAR|nr:hypothetical protein BT96DRAFT_1004243 [Gymnopus androsaceus JB14]